MPPSNSALAMFMQQTGRAPAEQMQQWGQLTDKQLMEYAILGNHGMEDTALQGVVAGNMNKDFVQRIVNANPNVSNFSPNMDGSSSTHLMQSGDGYVYPRIIQQDGQFTRNNPRSGEDINMGDAGAEWFAQNYKRTNPAGFGVTPQAGTIEQIVKYNR
jgi:hypothetical protein